MPEAPPLSPFPLDVLLGRIAHEWDSRQRIFDLPTARFWKGNPGVDLGFSFLGRRAATPVGPAAGPHSQMAQNIILGWLAGARLFELKTIQILDELEIGRPCIDMQTIGYNIEWSQELLVHQSTEEYVKAWMIIEILKRWDTIAELIGDPGPHVFDMSVGYDLAGISTDKVAGFIDGLMDAGPEIERLRPMIDGAFAGYRGLDFPTRIADTVTLSTFHGCPPDEIEAITKHLITRHDVDVIVKLNPTLLGFDRVDQILHDVLGYRQIPVSKPAFEADLQFGRGIELIGGLREFAAAHDKKFGIKLTNTLVVDNHKGWMPDDPMYLSGAPLHTITVSLLNALMEAMPGILAVGDQGGDVQVSFSAGINKENLAETLGTGVVPTTICSDLLKPGGYGRLAPMLKRLTEEMTEAGCADLPAWRRHRHQLAVDAGHRDAVAAHVDAMVNGEENELYSLAGNEKLPREVDHVLEMWGCVACNFCVTVCPNDAFFRLPTPKDSGIDGRQQYFVLMELCNECGNCMTFCPEEGDPAQIKPRLFIDENRFEAIDGQGFFIRRDNGGLAITAGAGWEDQIPRLTEMLNAEEGLPLDRETL